MPIPVILNPAARSTKAAALEHALRRLSPEPELHLTSGPGDAAVIAEKLAAAGIPESQLTNPVTDFSGNYTARAHTFSIGVGFSF